MRIRCLIYIIALLLGLSLPFQVFADEFPLLPEIPALASAPPLPSIGTFGTPKPPDLLENVETRMPGIELWEEILNDKKNEKEKVSPPPPPPGPRESAPIDPSFLATLSWPLHGTIYSGFGPRNGRMHYGVDIPAPKGTPIQAAAPGVVAEARSIRGYGHTVIIEHENGVRTLYAHCSSLAVKNGERVESGQVIAYVGNTGYATSSHLHLGVLVKGTYRDPTAFLKERPRLANRP